MPPPYSKTNLYSNCTQSPKKNLESLDFSRFLGSFFLFKLDFGNYILCLIKFCVTIFCIIILDILCILYRFETFCKQFASICIITPDVFYLNE